MSAPIIITLMAVDDEPLHIEPIREILREVDNGDTEPICFMDPERYLERIKKPGNYVCVLDYNLNHRLDGHDLYLQTRLDRPNAQIIILTANTDANVHQLFPRTDRALTTLIKTGNYGPKLKTEVRRAMDVLRSKRNGPTLAERIATFIRFVRSLITALKAK